MIIFFRSGRVLHFAKAKTWKWTDIRGAKYLELLTSRYRTILNCAG